MIGEIKPLVVPTKFMMPYSVPAKFGARSCEFCKFVIVAAPLNPSDNVMTATTRYLSNASNVIESKNNPGITCARQRRGSKKYTCYGRNDNMTMNLNFIIANYPK